MQAKTCLVSDAYGGELAYPEYEGTTDSAKPAVDRFLEVYGDASMRSPAWILPSESTSARSPLDAPGRAGPRGASAARGHCRGRAGLRTTRRPVRTDRLAARAPRAPPPMWRSSSAARLPRLPRSTRRCRGRKAGSPNRSRSRIADRALLARTRRRGCLALQPTRVRTRRRADKTTENRPASGRGR